MWWIVVEVMNIGNIVENIVMFSVCRQIGVGCISVFVGCDIIKCSSVVLVEISIVSVVKCVVFMWCMVGLLFVWQNVYDMVELNINFVFINMVCELFVICRLCVKVKLMLVQDNNSVFSFW